MSKVAVASTDGITINEHFGRSKEFWVYEVNETGAYQFLERRQTPQIADPSHTHAASKAAELLADVEAVLVAQIGPRAEIELLRKGVFALCVTGPIDKALQAYGRRGKLLRNRNATQPAQGCQAAGSTGVCGCSCNSK